MVPGAGESALSVQGSRPSPCCLTLPRCLRPATPCRLSVGCRRRLSACAPTWTSQRSPRSQRWPSRSSSPSRCVTQTPGHTCHGVTWCCAWMFRLLCAAVASAPPVPPARSCLAGRVWLTVVVAARPPAFPPARLHVCPPVLYLRIRLAADGAAGQHGGLWPHPAAG